MAEEVEDVVEERSEEKMLSYCNGGKPSTVLRIAKFIRPNTGSVNEAASQMTLLSESMTYGANVVVGFKGWRNPHKNWGDWIQKLDPSHASMWKQLGIHDSIMSSNYKICCDQELVLGLCKFWCPQTNTFVFPWGEGTIRSITLEDLLILGGFPLIGESVRSSLPVELHDIENITDLIEPKPK